MCADVVKRSWFSYRGVLPAYERNKQDKAPLPVSFERV